MIDLKGKRILFLEGESMLIPVLEKAHQLGVYSVIANWYSPDVAPAKLVSNAHYEVDFNDMDAMLKIIRDEEIDGIFTAFTDSHLEVFQKLCKAANLPCYTNEKLCEIMVNKAEFKKYCSLAGLPVVEEYSMELAMSENAAKNIEFPVIVKPVDNSGARGISICFDSKSLKSAISKALEFSQAKDVIIEKYILAEYALADFMVQDGKAYFCASSDKPINNDDKSNVVLPGAYIYPSKHDDLIQSRLTAAVQRFVEMINYQNGIMCLELIVEGDNVFVIEPQFRYGGKFQDMFIDSESGIDEIELLLGLSVYGRYGDDTLSESIKTHFNRNYVLMNILVGKGTITNIPTEQEINKACGSNVELYIPRKNAGDVINPDGSVVQMFGKVVLSADSREELLTKMRLLQSNLEIKDQNGYNMVISSVEDNYC